MSDKRNSVDVYCDSNFVCKNLSSTIKNSLALRFICSLNPDSGCLLRISKDDNPSVIDCYASNDNFSCRIICETNSESCKISCSDGYHPFNMLCYENNDTCESLRKMIKITLPCGPSGV